MNCTHCGSVTRKGVRIFHFKNADKELQLRLCNDCINELLSDEQIELAH